MASFSPYGGTDNLTRSSAISTGPGSTPRDRPAGLTVAVLTRDRPDLLLPLMADLDTVVRQLGSQGLGAEVVIGDTGSRDPDVLAAYAEAPPEVTVVPDMVYHFSANNNALVRSAPVGFDTLLLLNNDVHLGGAVAVTAMLAALAEPETGIVGLRMTFPDGSVQHEGIELVPNGFRRGLPWHPGRGEVYRPGPPRYRAAAVTGACLMIRRSLWDCLGGLDEQYERECQDVDLCFAARRSGWGITVVDAGPIVHLENATRGMGDGSITDRRLFLRRWRTFTTAVRP